MILKNNGFSLVCFTCTDGHFELKHNDACDISDKNARLIQRLFKQLVPVVPEPVVVEEPVVETVEEPVVKEVKKPKRKSKKKD